MMLRRRRMPCLVADDSSGIADAAYHVQYRTAPLMRRAERHARIDTRG